MKRRNFFFLRCCTLNLALYPFRYSARPAASLTTCCLTDCFFVVVHLLRSCSAATACLLACLLAGAFSLPREDNFILGASLLFVQSGTSSESSCAVGGGGGGGSGVVHGSLCSPFSSLIFGYFVLAAIILCISLFFPGLSTFYNNRPAGRRVCMLILQSFVAQLANRPLVLTAATWW